MKVTFRPLTTWAPRPSTPENQRRWSPFMRRESGDSYRRVPMTLTTTLRDLEREIEMLGGSNVIIAIGLRERDIRNDGWPAANAPQPAHPGVEISFDSRFGRLTYATDVCQRWQDNVRSIAKGLEALRAVDRFGVSERGQQYAGWKALPGTASSMGPTTVAEARSVLVRAAGLPDANGQNDRELYRMAARRTHPDAGGQGWQFQRVEEAWRLLQREGAA